MHSHPPGTTPIRDRHLAIGALLVAALAGCGRRAAPDRAPQPLAIEPRNDTASVGRLHVEAHAAARVWLARVTPARFGPPEAPLPQALPDTLPFEPQPPPALVVDPDLKPPILRAPGRLEVPAGVRAGSVELEVRVDERGEVTDAQWAGGSEDASLLAAARACARGMRFYPALRAGRPVAVWCRQRFDFRPR